MIVRGRVQGVFFRSETRSRARSAGLRGWVQNRSDGAVEAVFEGSHDAVESMLRWCERGPAGARVDSVEVAWEEPADDAAFVVR